MVLFLKTGLIWGGGYLPLFTSQDMLDVYADVELGVQIDPPEQIGDSWEVRVPTSLIMLQETSELPEFPVEGEEDALSAGRAGPQLLVDDSVPF